MSEKETLLSPIELAIVHKKLTFLYEPSAENTLYDLCSLDGRILLTGKINTRQLVSLDLSTFSKGHYNLFIMDGTQVHKRLFHYASDLSSEKV
jgi:hypothetical protein